MLDTQRPPESLVEDLPLPVVPAPAGMDHIVAGITEFSQRFPDVSVLDLRRFGEAREHNLRADKLELEIAEKRGSLIPLQTVKEIRDDTIALVNNHLGPSFQALLEQHGVPEEVGRQLHEQVYMGLAAIYQHHSNRVGAAQRATYGH